MIILQIFVTYIFILLPRKQSKFEKEKNRNNTFYLTFIDYMIMEVAKLRSFYHFYQMFFLAVHKNLDCKISVTFKDILTVSLISIQYT